MVEFEFPPPVAAWSTNQDRNLHPMERSKIVSQWKNTVRLLFRSHVVKGGISLPLAAGVVHVWIPFKDKRRRDPHNYCGTVLKAIIDGLVAGGAWPDDTPEFVGHREPVLYKGTNVRVWIEER